MFTRWRRELYRYKREKPYIEITMPKMSRHKEGDNIIKKTSAKFIQPLNLQKFVLNKRKYLAVLKKNNIPIIDTIYFKIQDNMNVTNILKKLTLYVFFNTR